MLARVKLKGIDGGPHKRWSMWFNSMIREIDIYWNVAEMQQLLAAGIQVLHGCRQLVL